jgi:hypothetical protein
LSDAAKKLAKETGALIYWQDVAAANMQIEQDNKTLATIKGMLNN